MRSLNGNCQNCSNGNELIILENKYNSSFLRSEDLRWNRPGPELEKQYYCWTSKVWYPCSCQQALKFGTAKYHKNLKISVFVCCRSIDWYWLVFFDLLIMVFKVFENIWIWYFILKQTQIKGGEQSPGSRTRGCL